LESSWGILPKVPILVKAGECPIGGGVVLPSSAGSKGSGAGILSQKANSNIAEPAVVWNFISTASKKNFQLTGSLDIHDKQNMRYEGTEF
jgi:hypothetical protein